MKVNLNGKVALVTGAARHIGKAIGDVYIANGAKVVYTDISFDDPKTTSFESSDSMNAIMDVTEFEQVEAVIDKTVKKFGHLDIIVNNAATYSLKHRVSIEEFPREEWEKIINVTIGADYKKIRDNRYFISLKKMVAHNYYIYQVDLNMLL